VHKGECPPDIYTSIIDRKMMETHKNLFYATFNNVPDNRIADIEHLDERRLSIGLPTWEMEKKRNELIDKKHEE
jgi:hypothetical protein